MSVQIFLGEPPANIKQWIIDHHKPTPTPTNKPLCFTAEEDGSSVSLVFYEEEGFEMSDPTPPNLQYSLNDAEHWTDYEMNQIIPLAKDAKVFFKANGQNERISAPPLAGPPITYKFVMEGKIAASGNIQYLLDETGSRTDVPTWCCYEMFSGCTNLTQAPDLPATTLANGCYYYMFYNCSSLTQAPELPATTLADDCYSQMFDGCTSLTQAPDLPATTLANNCYRDMFYGCSSLTQAPALPATTLADDCYYGMFYKCTSLAQAPDLPATTLANNCYYFMFNGCTSLTQAPALPATTLADQCYMYMFYKCTSLAQAPALPATTLANNCYLSMFSGCTEFTEVRMKAEMEGVYDPSVHGNTTKTVVYDL